MCNDWSGLVYINEAIVLTLAGHSDKERRI